MILDDEVRENVDFPTMLDESGVELVILIACKLFIKKANLIENISLIATEWNGIYLLDLFDPNFVSGTTNTERVTATNSNSFADSGVFGR